MALTFQRFLFSQQAVLVQYIVGSLGKCVFADSNAWVVGIQASSVKEFWKKNRAENLVLLTIQEIINIKRKRSSLYDVFKSYTITHT
jgi:hypothetical protein